MESNTAQTEEKQQAAFFIVSTSKLFKMYILTLGLYGLYWFYKNWKLQKALHNLDVMPIPRAIFSIFFTHSLFRRISDTIDREGISCKFNASLMAWIYVVSLLGSSIIAQLGKMNTIPNVFQLFDLVGILVSVYPLMNAQDAINQINGDIVGITNSEYSWHNILLMIFGVIIWILSLLGLLAVILGGQIHS